MSLTFVRASSQYAEAVGSPLSAGNNPIFSVAGWYKPSSIAGGSILGIGGPPSSDYIALGMTGAGTAFVEIPGATATAGTLSDGVWHHIAGVQANASSRVAYLDGVAGSANTSVTYQPSGMDRTTAGGLVLNGNRLSFAGGSVAHLAIWNTALSDVEVASLATGAVPSTIQPGSLVFYAELDGAASPEEDLVGTLDLVWGAGGAAPSQGADNPPVGGTTFERSASLDVATLIQAVGRRDLLRSASLPTVTEITASGISWSILERSAALTVTTGIETTTQRVLQRQASLSIATAIGTGRQVELIRAASLAVALGISASGGRADPRLLATLAENGPFATLTASSGGTIALTE